MCVPVYLNIQIISHLGQLPHLNEYNLLYYSVKRVTKPSVI